MQKPMISTLIDEYGHDPFVILISCLLSLRAKDTATLPVCRQLFSRARTPKAILKISIKQLEKILYQVGFYKKKAAVLYSVCTELIDRFAGIVPNTEEQLLSINGVGRKTANLVLGDAFGVPAICVDTHVHRISNQLAIVQTETPQETEEALKRILPIEYWIEYNKLLVMWGQNNCVPVSPFCSLCPIYHLCERKGITKYR